MESTSKKIYFPGLNGLRFIAAALVVLEHVEMVKTFQNIPSLKFQAFQHIGNYSVTFFFALSGFLISYLLFTEKEVTGDIAVRKFYMRRILRIWPLYYFVLILAFFILPIFPIMYINTISDTLNGDFWGRFVLYFFMVPNIARAVWHFPIPHSFQIWSIGVEEQFYILWPAIIKKSKSYLKSIITVIVVYLVIKVILKGITHMFPSNVLVTGLKNVVNYTRIDCMATGALFGYYLFKNKIKKDHFVYNKYLQAIIYLLVIAIYLFFNGDEYFFFEEFQSVLYGIIILNVASNPKSILKLENKYFNYLGKISYGIYMYHVIVIELAIKLLLPYLDGSNRIMEYLIHPISLVATIALSAISYRFLESYFLKLKLKQTKILSGGNI